MDPIVAKALTHAAIKVATDGESRKKAIQLILAPAVGFLLLVAMILQILTLPVDALGNVFQGDELTHINDIRADTDFAQLIDSDSEDWQENYGSNYEGVVFSSGGTEVMYYSQFDSRWANIMYGKSSSIGKAGCGPTSMAIVISTLKGEPHDPVELARWSVAHGHRCEGNGSYHSLIPEAAKAYGLKVEGAGKKDGQKIVDALSSGKLVVGIYSKGHFTKAGHFIVLRGVTEDGKILVADPASYSRSEQTWPLSIIMNEARTGAGAGGPFWIIGL